MSAPFTASGTDSRAARRPATVRLARWSATHPWRAVIGYR